MTHRRTPALPVVLLAMAALAACGNAGHTATHAATHATAPVMSTAPAPATAPRPTRPAGGPFTPSPATRPANSLCGFLPTARPDKILVIWEENHSYRDVIGSSDAPTFNAVANSCASATNYEAVTHPSLPNYLAMTSGGTFSRAPYDGDCSPRGACVVDGPSVFSQEAQSGHSWASFAESMRRPCDSTNSGPYVVRHNPAVYYPGLASTCAVADLSLGTPSAGPLAAVLQAGTLPTLTTVTPNVDHDMHDGTVAEADAWLHQWLPAITGGPDYRSGRLVVIIAWDEGRGGGDQPSAAPLLVLAAGVTPGARIGKALDDYSVLRAIEAVSGVPPLGRAASAQSVTAALGLTSN